jgi:hypothetical protein
MNYIHKGMAAGFAGAFVLAGFLLLNREAGFMPELDWIAALGMLTSTGDAGGWLLHFVIGALWGALFAWLDPDLPGDGLRQRGIVFSLGGWLLMMFVLMPLAGPGFFGLDYSVLLPLAALALHVIFGAVMGGTYGWLILQAAPLRYRQPRESFVRRAPPARAIAERPAPAPNSTTDLPTIESPPVVTIARGGQRNINRTKTATRDYSSR